MSQSDINSYGQTLPVAQPGQKFGLGVDQVDSFAAEGAVLFGRGVIAGTDPNKQVKVADAAGLFRGVACFTHTREQLDGVAQYLDKDTVNVFKSGRIYVETTEAVVAGDVAKVVIAAGVDQGKFAKTAVIGDTAGPVGRFVHSAAVGELAVLEVEGGAALVAD